MTINLRDNEKLSLEQIRKFLGASKEIAFRARDRREVYAWVTRTLRQQGYARLVRAAKGVLRRYLEKMTGMSRAQVTRLIGKYRAEGEVRETGYRRHRFPKRYTRGDVELLAAVDEAHETLSGPATRKILEREYREFGQREYQRLGSLSVAHLYRLRRHWVYRQRRVHYQATRPTKVAIGERRRPRPQGQPGYLRVDTVHQGDRDGVKGVYHINAVDEVTQWQVVGAAPAISEAWLQPVLAAILRQFPFALRGFHSDNGSEFLNTTVARLLHKLLIEQTKSRPGRCNDNGLVEAKNGAVIRKHMGYAHISADQAERVQAFYEQHFNPYLNFHRPCAQPEIVVQPNGKRKRIYRRWATPWETFRALPKAHTYLRSGLPLAALAQMATAESDTQCARHMQQAKRRLFAGFGSEKQSA